MNVWVCVRVYVSLCVCVCACLFVGWCVCVRVCLWVGVLPRSLCTPLRTLACHTSLLDVHPCLCGGGGEGEPVSWGQLGVGRGASSGGCTPSPPPSATQFSSRVTQTAPRFSSYPLPQPISRPATCRLHQLHCSERPACCPGIDGQQRPLPLQQPAAARSPVGCRSHHPQRSDGVQLPCVGHHVRFHRAAI